MERPQPLTAPARAAEESHRAVDGQVLFALGALYFIWGSTYLAIRIAIAAYPPFLLSGIRFLSAGLILLGYQRLRGAPMPQGRQWLGAALVGALMTTANALVGLAEQSVSSGLAAVLVASMPLYVALLGGLFGRWPDRREWMGLLVGLSGVVLLNLGGELQASPWGAALLVLSTLCWALGSVWGRRLPMPAGLSASGAQMLCGGVLQSLFALVHGDRLQALPGAQPTLALVYLVVFGSLVGYTSYAFLLGRVRPALATSYAYVNPVVAVGLGALLLGEPVSSLSLVALTLVLSGVALVAFKPAAR